MEPIFEQLVREHQLTLPIEEPPRPLSPANLHTYIRQYHLYLKYDFLRADECKQLRRNGYLPGMVKVKSTQSL